MRSDMHKVVIERPRHGSRRPSKKTRLKIHSNIFDPESEYDDLPNRISSGRERQYGSHAKSFSDLLGPLRGFLKQQVGRPWNEVFSQLCQHLDKRKTTGLHIFQHLDWEVTHDCYVGIDGIIYRLGGRYPGWEVYGFYVHPETGVLEHKSFPRFPWNDLKERVQNTRFTEIKVTDEIRCFLHCDNHWRIQYHDYKWSPDRIPELPKTLVDPEAYDKRTKYCIDVRTWYAGRKELKAIQAILELPRTYAHDAIRRHIVSIVLNERNIGFKVSIPPKFLKVLKRKARLCAPFSSGEINCLLKIGNSFQIKIKI